MKAFLRVGSIAAFYQAIAYLTAMVFFIFIMDHSSVTDSQQKLELLMSQRQGVYLMSTISYVVFGIVLVLLAYSLYKRLKIYPGMLPGIALIFGLIWAVLVIASGMIFNSGLAAAAELYKYDPKGAAIAWVAISAIQDGIGGGNEIIGGIWSLLISAVALKNKLFPKALNYLGVLVGFSGIISAVPVFAETGSAAFGLGQLVWFIWLGIVLMLINSKDVNKVTA